MPPYAEYCVRTVVLMNACCERMRVYSTKISFRFARPTTIQRRLDVEFWRTDCTSRHLKMSRDAPRHRRCTNHALRFFADERRTFTPAWDGCNWRSGVARAYHPLKAGLSLLSTIRLLDRRSRHAFWFSIARALRTSAISVCGQSLAAPSNSRARLQHVRDGDHGRENARLLYDTESRVNDTPIS